MPAPTAHNGISCHTSLVRDSNYFLAVDFTDISNNLRTIWTLHMHWNKCPFPLAFFKSLFWFTSEESTKMAHAFNTSHMFVYGSAGFAVVPSKNCWVVVQGKCLFYRWVLCSSPFTLPLSCTRCSKHSSWGLQRTENMEASSLLITGEWPISIVYAAIVVKEQGIVLSVSHWLAGQLEQKQVWPQRAKPLVCSETFGSSRCHNPFELETLTPYPLLYT